MAKMNVLMIGTGEYTTGYVHGAAADSDKSAGVVALTLFDLRRRGIVGELSMAGTNGTKFPGIRRHLQTVVADVYTEMDVSFASYPADTVSGDSRAYQQALNALTPGDVVTIFTPDQTHYAIAMAAVEQRCHVLVAKPIVQTIEQHLALAAAAHDRGVLVAMEVHKRWDPIYTDARDRIRSLGEFSYFSAYMSQPKSQLETFRTWAGTSSDISYYLNAHHVDFNVWAVSRSARPRRVVATACTGVAQSQGIDTEDTVTLTVQWENLPSGNLATAVYTASWIAPKSDVHSQQRFFYMGHHGEITVDQAHRGYTIADDARGYVSANPLFMKYRPGSRGEFAGQAAYGYRSIEDFVLAAQSIRDGDVSVSAVQQHLATVDDTVLVTAVLEAGRCSLDNDGRAVSIDYDANGRVVGLSADA